MNFNSLNFDSKKALIARLTEDLSFIQDEMTVTKSNSSLRLQSNRQKYAGYRVAANTIKGVIAGLENNEISKSEAQKALRKAYGLFSQSHNTKIVHKPKSDSIFSADSTEIPESVDLDDEDFQVKVNTDKKEEDRKEGIDSFVRKDPKSKNKHDDTEIANQLGELRLMRNKLPSKIKGVYSVTRVPIVPIFNNIKVNNSTVLNAAGFKTIHVSGEELEGYTILENQAILLLDYKKYNAQHLKESGDSYTKDMEKYNRNLLVWKEKKKESDDLHAQYDADLEEYHEKLEKYNSQKTLFAKYQKEVAKYEELKDLYIKNKKLFDQGKISKEPVPPKVVKKMNAPVRPVAPSEPPAFDMPKPIRPKKPVDYNTSDLSEVINEVLTELEEATNAEYVLMSDKHLRNPRGQDIFCFWIAEKWKVRNLERKFGRILVKNWGFAF